MAERSGELLTGGYRIVENELAQGYYVAPTVLGNVDNRSELAQTETFGPVVSMIRFSDDDQAVRIANDTAYGLNAFIHTRDLVRAHTVARQLGAGSIWIDQLSRISPQGPYGSYKRSGAGRTGGLEGLHEFQQIKNIRIGLGWAETERWRDPRSTAMPEMPCVDALSRACSGCSIGEVGPRTRGRN